MSNGIFPQALGVYQQRASFAPTTVGPLTDTGTWTTLRTATITSSQNSAGTYGGTGVRSIVDLACDVTLGALARITADNGAVLGDNGNGPGTGPAISTIRPAVPANHHADRFWLLPVTANPTTYTFTLQIRPDGSPTPSVTCDPVNNTSHRASLQVVEAMINQ